RQIPLVIPGKGEKGEAVDYNSFSLEIVDAYESILGILPRTKNILARQIAKHQFVYTSFLLQQQFPRVSAMDVLSGNEDAIRALRHRIVLIGGNRHKSKQGSDWA